MFKRLVKPIIVLGLMVMLVVGSGGNGVAHAATFFDDNSGAWSYTPGWTIFSAPGAINDTIHFSRSLGAVASVTCPATDIGGGRVGVNATLVYSKAFNRGFARLSVTQPGSTVPINGVSTLFDQYGPGVARQQSFFISAASNTPIAIGSPLVVRVQVSGQKNPASSDIFVDVDGLTC